MRKERREENQDSWEFQWVVEVTPDIAEVQSCCVLAAIVAGVDPESATIIQPVIAEIDPDRNWLEESYRGFVPFRVGSFYICGTHATPAPGQGDTLLRIDAATAFGSGEHATTAGCLLLMQDIHAAGWKPQQVLDLGCGSGILGIAACKLWSAPVLASDIDPECIAVTQRHQTINAIGAQMKTHLADGFDGIDGPYDLVIANILAGPLLAMAQDLAGRVRPGRYAILSGLLQTQAADIIACYGMNGLHPPEKRANRIDRDGWTALLLQRTT